MTALKSRAVVEIDYLLSWYSVSPRLQVANLKLPPSRPLLSLLLRETVRRNFSHYASSKQKKYMSCSVSCCDFDNRLARRQCMPSHQPTRNQLRLLSATPNNQHHLHPKHSPKHHPGKALLTQLSPYLLYRLVDSWLEVADRHRWNTPEGKALGGIQ